MRLETTGMSSTSGARAVVETREPLTLRLPENADHTVVLESDAGYPLHGFDIDDLVEVSLSLAVDGDFYLSVLSEDFFSLRDPRALVAWVGEEWMQPFTEETRPSQRCGLSQLPEMWLDVRPEQGASDLWIAPGETRTVFRDTTAEGVPVEAKMTNGGSRRVSSTGDVRSVGWMVTQ